MAKNYYEVLNREEKIDKENLNRALQDETIPEYTKEFLHLIDVCDSKKVYLSIWRDLGVLNKVGYLKFIDSNVFFTDLDESIIVDLSKVAKIENENNQVVYVNENRQNSDLYTFAKIFGKLPAKAAFACRQEERQHTLDMLGRAAYTDFNM